MHRLGLNHDMTSVVQTKVSGEAEGVVTSSFHSQKSTGFSFLHHKPNFNGKLNSSH